MKHEPTIGEHLYLHRNTYDYWVNMVRTPFTVISVNKNKTVCTVQEAECIFNSPRYFDSLPIDIVPNPNGEIMTLRWNAKKEQWQESPAGSCPKCAVFGQYDYQPYLN